MKRLASARRHISATLSRKCDGRILATLSQESWFAAPTGVSNDSPGQRPGELSCLNPSLASTFILSSAPSIVNVSSPIRCAPSCMPTWQPFFRISSALPTSSIRSMITFISSSIWPVPSPSARPLRRSRNLPRSGSRPKARSLPHLLGNRDMGHFPSVNPKLRPCGITSPASKSIIDAQLSRTNTGYFLNGTVFHSMNGMCGTNGDDPVYGQKANDATQPHSRSMPQVRRSAFQERANGPAQSQPRATPWVTGQIMPPALKGRPNHRLTFRSPFQGSYDTQFFTQGVALGCHGSGRWPSEVGMCGTNGASQPRLGPKSRCNGQNP